MNWMKHKTIYFLISSIFIIPGLFSLFRYGLKLSLEFTGGSQITILVSSQDKESLLKTFADKKPEIISESQDSITLKTTESTEEEVISLIATTATTSSQIKLESFESIGPILGQETIKKTFNALVLSSLLLLFYISNAFKQFKYGVSAILAMLHDTIILLGSFSLLGRFYGIEVDLLFVTAILTILSFSVHDTIVVYDRIRELSHKQKGVDFVSLVNQAVSETMVRSLNNSLTIIFMLIAMFLMGGESTKYFSLALLIGTVTGTYSSTFTAAPLLVVWHQLFEKNK